MSVQTAMAAIAAADGTLSTLITGQLVSSHSATGLRFFTDFLPQGVTFPAVTFQVTSGVVPDYTFGLGHDLDNVRVQVDGYDTTSVKRATLRAALVGAFDGYSSASIGGEEILGIEKENEMEMVEELDKETQAYRIYLDFLVYLRGYS